MKLKSNFMFAILVLLCSCVIGCSAVSLGLFETATWLSEAMVYVMGSFWLLKIGFMTAKKYQLGYLKGMLKG